jgi:hypothetical protein
MMDDLFGRKLGKISIAYWAVLVFVELFDRRTFIVILVYSEMTPLFIVRHEYPLWVATRRTLAAFLKLLLMLFDMISYIVRLIGLKYLTADRARVHSIQDLISEILVFIL